MWRDKPLRSLAPWGFMNHSPAANLLLDFRAWNQNIWLCLKIWKQQHKSIGGWSSFSLLKWLFGGRPHFRTDPTLFWSVEFHFSKGSVRKFYCPDYNHCIFKRFLLFVWLNWMFCQEGHVFKSPAAQLSFLYWVRCGSAGYRWLLRRVIVDGKKYTEAREGQSVFSMWNLGSSCKIMKIRQEKSKRKSHHIH